MQRCERSSVVKRSKFDLCSVRNLSDPGTSDYSIPIPPIKLELTIQLIASACSSFMFKKPNGFFLLFIFPVREYQGYRNSMNFGGRSGNI